MNSITQVSGKGVPIIGDDIDTDRIVPARFLKEVTFENMAQYLFRDVRFDVTHTPKSHPLNEQCFIDASIMVVNRNFGCGSSREHAPQAIKRAGFKAIIGESFSEIFRSNCMSLGLPTVTLEPNGITKIQSMIRETPNATLVIDLKNQQLLYQDMAYPIQLPASSRHAFLTGQWDILNLLNQAQDHISRIDASLHY